MRSLSPWRVRAWHTWVYLRGTPSQLCLESEEGCLRVPKGFTDQDGSCLSESWGIKYVESLLPVTGAFPLVQRELKMGAGASAPAQPPSPDALGQKGSIGIWLI